MIQSTAVAGLGNTVCVTGRDSSPEPYRTSRCGSVSALSVLVHYVQEDGSQIDVGGLDQMRNCDLGHGSSGGPVYKEHRAYGIISGGGGINGAPCTLSYVRAPVAETLMNVTVRMR